MPRAAPGSGALFTGWPIVGWSALVVGVLALAALASGSGEDGFRRVLRLTAGTSLVLFTAAFSASSLRRVWRNAATKWLLANRRYVGVSFAVSHTYHLAAILALASLSTQPFGAVTVFGGGFAYVVIAAMTATSFDTTAAWLGRRNWQRLHSFGVYYLWLIFALNYVTRATQTRTYLVFSLLLVGSLALRLFVRLRR